MARIPDKPDEIFEELTNDYRGAFDNDLVSIILYGSGAKGEYVPNKSDLNFLIVLTASGIDSLDRALELVTRWRRRNVAVPLFLTKRYIDSALDVFPIEFLNLKNHHRVVYGEDVLENLEVKRDDLRLQIERELRGKLLHLREGFLSTGDERDTLREMLSVSVPTFVSIFEALLYFLGEDVPHGRNEIFARMATRFDLDNRLFTQLINIRGGGWHGSKAQLHHITLDYIRQIRQIVEQVDAIQ